MIRLVCGPPGAGKTNWAREKATEADLVIDLDDLRSRARDEGEARKWRSMLEASAKNHDGDVYIVRTLADPVARREVAGRVGADETVVLETPADVASRRAFERDGDGSMAEPIRRWWDTYQRSEGDVVVMPDKGEFLPDKENDMAENTEEQKRPLNEHGFPDDTPLEEMEVSEQAAYWKHKARKHEGNSKSLKSELDGLRAEFDKKKDADEQPNIDEIVQNAIAEERKRNEAELGRRMFAAKAESLAKEAGIDEKRIDGLVASLNADAFVDGAEVNDKALTEFFESFPTAKGMPDSHGGFRKTQPVPGARGKELAEKYLKKN